MDVFLKRINNECKNSSSEKNKINSASARKLMLNHSWPGNIREMINIMTRAYVWTAGEVIKEEDIREALMPLPLGGRGPDEILGRQVVHGVDLSVIMQTVASQYLKEAMETIHSNMSNTTKLFNLSNYQTLTDWLKKYRVE